MAIKRRKRGNRIYLEEYRSVRRNGKVVSEFVRYLGPENKATTNGAGSVLTRLKHSNTIYSGAVKLLWSIAEDLHFVDTIDKISGSKSENISPGKILTVWAINRIIDPTSATKLERWVATTELPELTGITSENFNKDQFLYALDNVCKFDKEIGKETEYIKKIDDVLYQEWRNKHPVKDEMVTLAYDLTSVLFFGTTCPIAKSGVNSEHQNRLQVNVAAVIDRRDNSPIFHFVYEGNRNGSSTVKNMLVQLQQSNIKKGLLIVDRGIINKQMVNECTAMGWQILGGISKQVNDAKIIISTTEVSENPRTFACSSKSGPVYAVKANGQIFGRDKNLVVYANAQKALREREERNKELSDIGKALDKLSIEGHKWNETKLHKQINKIISGWGEFIDVRVSRTSSKRIEWKYRSRKLTKATQNDGKYLLLCTETKMNSFEIVETYFAKDFVEKAFRTLKSSIEIAPVRHYLSHRVKAYMFVCMLAYRLEMALRYMLIKADITEQTAEYMERFLYELSNVQKIDVKLSGQSKTWYLNITDFIKKTLTKINKPDLLNEIT